MRKFFLRGRNRRSQIIPLSSMPLTSKKIDLGDDDNSYVEKFDDLDSKKVENSSYLNHGDIQRKAIQVFYTEGRDRRKDFVHEQRWSSRCTCEIIHPNGGFRRLFDLFTVAWVLFLVFEIPFEIGFDWYERSRPLGIFLNFLDIWFALDIIINFRTGYIHHGTIVMNQSKIVKNYLQSWFLIDLLGTFPFEKILRGEAASRKSLKLIKYFKIPKLLRVSRVMKYVRDHKYVYDIFQVFVLVFTCLHIGACTWMLILDPCSEASQSIIADPNMCAQDYLYTLYAEAFHLSAVMILGISNIHIVGSSSTLDMLTEKREDIRVTMYIVSTLFMVGGLFLIALLISEMNVYLTGKAQGSATFQQKIDRVKHEMEYYAIPDELQLQVKAFYDYIWIHQKQYDEKTALLSDEQMSTDLQRKLALHLYKDVVSHISIFSEINDLLLGEICLSLRTRIFLPRDMIIFKGDVGKELFIIAKGKVEVLRDDIPLDQRHKHQQIFLNSGSFFGEIALIMEVRRTCSVQATTVCEVNILEQRAFDAILRENPDFARRMNELVVARQLERSLTRAEHVGMIDFQISKDDIDRAVSVVEKNMKKGLEDRLRNNDSFYDQSHGLNGSNLRRTKTMPEQLLFRRGENDINTVIEDIARRSTRFIKTENTLHSPRRQTLVENTIHSNPPNTIQNHKPNEKQQEESHSDSELTTSVRKRTLSNLKPIDNNKFQAIRTRNTRVGSFDERMTKRVIKNNVDSYLGNIQGNFDPDKSIIDVNKVHPSILNTRREVPNEDDVRDLIFERNKSIRFEESVKEPLRSNRGRDDPHHIV